MSIPTEIQWKIFWYRRVGVAGGTNLFICFPANRIQRKQWGGCLSVAVFQSLALVAGCMCFNSVLMCHIDVYFTDSLIELLYFSTLLFSFVCSFIERSEMKVLWAYSSFQVMIYFRSIRSYEFNDSIINLRHEEEIKTIRKADGNCAWHTFSLWAFSGRCSVRKNDFFHFSFLFARSTKSQLIIRRSFDEDWVERVFNQSHCARAVEIFHAGVASLSSIRDVKWLVKLGEIQHQTGRAGRLKAKLLK